MNKTKGRVHASGVSASNVALATTNYNVLFFNLPFSSCSNKLNASSLAEANPKDKLWRLKPFSIRCTLNNG